MALTRRDTLAVLMTYAAVLAQAGPGAAGPSSPGEGPALGPAAPFDFDRLKAMARARAAHPYAPVQSPPASLTDAIGYDAFGAIRYRPGAGLWADRPGDAAVRFFHMGVSAPTPVAIHVVDQGHARPLIYDEALFDQPADSPGRRLGALAGFAGFKGMNADHQTDWIAYLGASYFRSADPFNQYGLSARGLAVNTATAEPEEFPGFVAFWLEHPVGGDLVVYALLDGPSVAGAYRISHHRSPAGLVQDIAVELSFRAPVERLGLAPLTSMYWYGRPDHTPAQDWRPQIHDSDGLSLWTGAGERIWRPLNNPPRVMTNLFLDQGPKGFGLMQRDRAFDDYQDDGVFYDRRPSAWVEPVGDWGPGSVQLVEIPTNNEIQDNIVAFWTPRTPVVAGQVQALRYRLHWAAQEPGVFGVARAVATRTGRAGRPGFAAPSDRRKLVIDFQGSSLAGLTRQSGVEPVVEAHRGQVFDPVAYPVVGTDRWRLMFDVQADAGAAVDLRAYLRHGGAALTETWVYQVFAA